MFLQSEQWIWIYFWFLCMMAFSITMWIATMLTWHRVFRLWLRLCFFYFFILVPCPRGYFYTLKDSVAYCRPCPNNQTTDGLASSKCVACPANSKTHDKAGEENFYPKVCIRKFIKLDVWRYHEIRLLYWVSIVNHWILHTVITITNNTPQRTTIDDGHSILGIWKRYYSFIKFYDSGKRGFSLYSWNNL